MKLFVTCPKGIEPLLVDELKELGFTHVTPHYCGVDVEVKDLSAIYRINYCSRIASRVLLPLRSFNVYDARSLYTESRKIDWSNFLSLEKTFAIDANVNHPKLRHSLFCAQVLKDAICDQFVDGCGKRPNVEVRNPDVQLNLFIDGNFGVISFDTSGSTLNMRGYREVSVEAPIRESLAAACLRLAQYKGDEILYDPCCGSGTFLIEAALIATHTPPGYLRKRFGFFHLPDFTDKEWLQVKNEADSKRIPLEKGKIFGSDVNKSSCHATKVNLRAAGFFQSIEVLQADFRTETPAIKPNFLITNPPHGNRLSDVNHLKPLYRELGNFMKQNMPANSRGFVFVGDLELAKEVGLSPTKRHVLDNGGIDSRLLEFDIF